MIKCFALLLLFSSIALGRVGHTPKGGFVVKHIGIDDTRIIAVVGPSQQLTNVGDNSILGINSDDADPTIRNILLDAGKVKGQLLGLVNVSATGQFELDHNSAVSGGNLVKLNASTLTFNSKWDNVWLRWSGNNWVQVSSFIDIL